MCDTMVSNQFLSSTDKMLKMINKLKLVLIKLIEEKQIKKTNGIIDTRSKHYSELKNHMTSLNLWTDRYFKTMATEKHAKEINALFVSLTRGSSLAYSLVEKEIEKGFTCHDLNLFNFLTMVDLTIDLFKRFYNQIKNDLVLKYL